MLFIQLAPTALAVTPVSFSCLCQGRRGVGVWRFQNVFSNALPPLFRHACYCIDFDRMQRGFCSQDKK